jgi:hypothetical protein
LPGCLRIHAERLEKGKLSGCCHFEEVGMRSSRRNATTTPSAAPGSSPSNTNPRRRNFLLALGAGGAGAAALAARSLNGVTAVATDGAASEESYRETAHVKRYYETTKT